MRKAGIVGLLLLTCGAVLGSTVFREQVAEAAQAILPVRIMNTASESVPVNVTNGTLAVRSGEPAATLVDFASGPETIVPTVPEGFLFVLKNLRVGAFPNVSGTELTSGACTYFWTRPEGGGTATFRLTSFSLVPNSHDTSLFANDEGYLVLPESSSMALECDASAGSSFMYYASGDYVAAP